MDLFTYCLVMPTKPLLFILVSIILGALFFIHTEEDYCSDQGGVRLRAMLGSWTCYDKDSLKVIP